MPDTSLSFLDRLRTTADSGQWNRFVDLYSPFLRRALGAYGVPAQDVDDMTQDVMSVVVAELPAFEHSGRPGAFRNWLRTILTNRLRRYWEARKRAPRAAVPGAHGELEAAAVTDAALEDLWNREHNEWVMRRLMKLVEPEFLASTWRAFGRQVLDQVSPSEVARELGITVNAVLIAKSRVLRRLRQEARGFTD